MKIGCLINLLIYGALVAGYHHWLEATVESPAIWITACIFALFTVMALGALYNSLQTMKDCRALEAARAGLPPRHGHWTAVAGTIEALGQPMLAPFSQRECVLCEYEISRDTTVTKSDNQGTETRHLVDFSGMQMVPCAIRQGHERVQLVGFPNLDTISADHLRTREHYQQAQSFVRQTEWEDVGGLKAFRGFGGMWKALTEANESVRRDWRTLAPADCPWLTDAADIEIHDSIGDAQQPDNFDEEDEADDHAADVPSAFAPNALNDEASDEYASNDDFPDDSELDDEEDSDEDDEFSTFGPDDNCIGLGTYQPSLQEKRIDVGDEVVAIGTYDSMRSALVSSASKNGQMIRIYRDRLPAVANKLGGSTYRLLLGGILGLIFIHGVLYLGHWAYCSNDQTQRDWKERLRGAVKEGDQSLAAKMLDRGVDIDSPDDSGETLLMLARDPAMMQFLIARGANINAQDKKGFTALMYAAHQDRLVELKTLIDAGAKLDVRNTEYGTTALILAMGAERDECVAMLRAAGAEDDTVTAANGEKVLSADPPFVACQEYVRAIHAHDVEKVKAMSVFSGKFDYSDVDWNIWSGGRPASPRLVAGFVRGDDATVTVTGFTPNAFNATWVYQLKRVDGVWKVVRERWATNGI